MSDNDVPAGQAGGRRDVFEDALEARELPERLRVHALARLMEVSSRDVLDALDQLGEPARGAQSSIDRETALRVIETLTAGPAGATAEAGTATVGPGATAGPGDGRRGADVSSAAGPAAPASSAGAAGPAPSTAGPALPLFAAPSPMFLPPDPVAARQATPVPDEVDVEEATSAEPAEVADEGGETKRRRRRGRRGRGRGRGAEDAEESPAEPSEIEDGARANGADPTGERAETQADAEPDDTDEAGDDTDEDATDEVSPTRRRRRRRRRKDSDDLAEADAERDVEDAAATVTRVREPRGKADNGDLADTSGIQGVRGSTRLEAKRQRRRDGRDAGRRRAPVLSEAEFLARRESVERTMVVRQQGERSEIGVLEDGVLVEHFVTSSGGSSLVGNVYLGRVQNVLPSMEAAFVDIGRGRNAVLYAGEVDWDAAGLAGKARRIEQALSSGDSILVQVTKDPVGHKGARLTTQISLPGRFLVYVPSGGTHGISRKLPDTERRRLKDLLKEIVPEDAGVIIRTASEGVSQEALERDVRRLQAQWDVVKNKAESAKNGKSKAPELLYEEPDLMIKVVRDQFNEDFAKLVVQGDDAWDTLHAYVSHVAPELGDRLHRHVGPTDVFTEYRIDEQLMKALDRKVWLPSGGTLVIDRTEAMTVIDVNTGKFTGSGGNLEETVTRNNLEAAEEIVRQLRLRDIGGIIVIDFIDMVLESNRDLVLRRLTECLGRDRTRHQVAEVTSLGLVQMTRKRVGMGLLEAFSTPCEHCRGRGVIVSSEPVEPKAEHGSLGAGGRRRNRGGEGRVEGRGGESGEHATGGNGRRGRGTGGAGHGGTAARNGRPVPAPPQPVGPVAEAAKSVEAGADAPQPVGPVAEAAKPVEAAADPTRPAEPVAGATQPAEPGAGATQPVGPVADAAQPVEAAADPTRPAEPVAGASPTLPSEPALAPEAPSSVLTQTTATAGVSAAQRPVRPEEQEPLVIGAGQDQQARPARRRRRMASRPAGPPAAGGTSPDPV